MYYKIDFKIGYAIGDADIEIEKSLHTLFDKYLAHMLMKFEQNCELFDKVLTPFWKPFLQLKQFFDAKL